MNYLYFGLRTYWCGCGGGVPMPTQPIITTTDTTQSSGTSTSTPPSQPVNPWTDSVLDFPVGIINK